MKKWYFREANYRTFRKHTLTKQKPPTMRRFSKMVPLASLCGGGAHRSLTASRFKNCSLSLAELRPARSPDVAAQVQPSANITTIKKASAREAFLMVPLARIGLATPSLPMTCSTTELQRHG